MTLDAYSDMSAAFDPMPVIQALVAYLSAHPQASDTAEGMARWWLRDDAIEVARLEQALELMEQGGLMERTTAGDGRVRWRRSGDAATFERAYAAFVVARAVEGKED